MRAVHVVSLMLVLVHDSNFIKRTFVDKFLPTWNHACLLTNKYTMHVIVDKTRQFLSQNVTQWREIDPMQKWLLD